MPLIIYKSLTLSCTENYPFVHLNGTLENSKSEFTRHATAADHETTSLTCSTQPDAVKQDVFVRKSYFDMHPGFSC